MRGVMEHAEADIQPADEAAARERLAERVAELDATIMECLERRRRARIEAGRCFRELKKLLGHGKWQQHFGEAFAPRGIKLRTVERWMKAARKEDAAAENAKVSFFGPATDPGAQQVKEATEQAQAEVALSPGGNKPQQNLRRVYRLPLRLTEAETSAMDALRQSKDWPVAEKRILTLLRRLWLKFGVKRNARRRS